MGMALRLMLTADFGVQWAQRKRNCGRWEYMWDHETETGYFILEFSAKNSRYWRKHIMQQTDDGTAVLLPTTHWLYDALNEWWYDWSCLHENYKYDAQEITMAKKSQDHNVDDKPLA